MITAVIALLTKKKCNYLTVLSFGSAWKELMERGKSAKCKQLASVACILYID